MDDPQKVVEDYKFMLEKSQSFFAGLRDLPQYENKQWQLYFQKTFEIYTKLWKFQQEKRTILENREHYGLKRWEIGEIASKIGQLYYHYYLRTSETLYLRESFVFYDAIRARFYFKDVADANSAPLMIKKLRYYARFVVVCLLLDNRDYVADLLDELQREVRQYDERFSPPDSSEWHVVVQELEEFLKADDLLDVINIGRAKPLPPTPQLEVPSDAPRVELAHAVLAGACKEQIKFSELTLDIFRMLLTVEAPPPTDSSSDAVRHNPHKHLLYRPNIGQLLVVLASICKDLTDNQAVLLYVSSDPYTRSPDEPSLVEPTAAPQSGLMLSARSPSDAMGASSSAGNGLLAHDVMPFTRRPFVLVADSPGSGCFLDLQNVFGAPLLCLLSPEACPADIKGPTAVGNLFTLFLHAPLHALWVALKQEAQMEQDIFEQAEAKLSQILSSIQTKLSAAPELDHSIKLFMTDELICNLMLRFIFFEAVAQLHSSFQEEAFHPRSTPAMPASVAADSEIQTKVKELAGLMNGTEYIQ